MRGLRALAILAVGVPLAFLVILFARSDLPQSWPEPGGYFVPRSVPTDAATAGPAKVATVTPVPGSVRFAVIGDFGSGSPNEAAVAKLVTGWNPDFVVTVGDDRYNNPYGSNYDTVVGGFYCSYLKDVISGPRCAGGTSAINRFFPATGNHDYSDGGGLKEYLGYFTLPGTGITTTNTTGTERYYDFVEGPVHFFVLDSMGAIQSSSDARAQKAWLQAQLAAAKEPWTLVIFHHPPYSSGIHGSNAAMQWPFAAWGADAVLAGHDHTYERLLIDGIPYFVNGLGGESRYGFRTPVTGSVVRYDRDFGAMLVDASPTSIAYQFVNRSGKVIDTYVEESPCNQR